MPPPVGTAERTTSPVEPSQRLLVAAAAPTPQPRRSPATISIGTAPLPGNHFEIQHSVQNSEHVDNQLVVVDIESFQPRTLLPATTPVHLRQGRQQPSPRPAPTRSTICVLADNFLRLFLPREGNGGRRMPTPVTPDGFALIDSDTPHNRFSWPCVEPCSANSHPSRPWGGAGHSPAHI